jgi:hypothetical protein
MLPSLRPLSEERRRHQRVKVALLGRYMLASTRQEYPCQTVDMSPGGVAFLAPVVGQLNERVVAYLDHLGRVEGTVVRTIPHGFAMTVSATPRKRDKLAAQLTWLANRHILGLPEDRRHDRIVPKNTRTDLVLPDGTIYPCRVVDVSLSGASVQIDMQPPLGTPVMLGRTQARVVRHIDGGIAVEFSRLQDVEQLEQGFD